VDGRAGDDDAPRLVRVSDVAELGPALDAAGVSRPVPVIAFVGGADGMDEAAQEDLAGVLRDVVVPSVERHGAAVVDGGTDSGVPRMLGRARARSGGFPLIGVAAESTVRAGGDGLVIDDAAEPEPHHSHLVLVPGAGWGDESPWLAAVADAIAADRPSLTVVVNGGEITYEDVARSLERGRPVVVLAGTGRTADSIAAARAGWNADPRAAALAASPLTRVEACGDLDAVRTAIATLLSGRPSVVRRAVVDDVPGEFPDDTERHEETPR
jgi:hypothetical protein